MFGFVYSFTRASQAEVRRLVEFEGSEDVGEPGEVLFFLCNPPRYVTAIRVSLGFGTFVGGGGVSPFV